MTENGIKEKYGYNDMVDVRKVKIDGRDAFFVANFFDKDGCACYREDAVEAHIHQYDEYGKWVGETTGSFAKHSENV